MLPTQNNNVIAQGLARLTDAYRNLPKIRGLTQSVLWSVQDLEVAIWTVINAKNLNPNTPPTGDLLTRIAKIVGLQRNGLTDALLWAAVQVKVTVDSSKGRINDLLKIVKQVTGIVPTYQMGPVARWAVQVLNTSADIGSLRASVSAASPAGTYGVLRSTSWPLSQTITWASVYGAGIPTQAPVCGFTSVYGPGLGIGAAVVGAMVEADQVSA